MDFLEWKTEDDDSVICMMCNEIGITKMRFSNDLSSIKEHIGLHSKQTNQCFTRCMKLCFPSDPIPSYKLPPPRVELYESVKTEEGPENVSTRSGDHSTGNSPCDCDDCRSKIRRGRQTFNYNCERCNYSSTFRGNMIRHAKTHEPQTSQIGQWECGYCKMLYKSRDRLRRHTVRNHTTGPNSLRNEICEFCKATFEWAYQLRYHKRSLHGIKTGKEPLEYFCDSCELRAKSKQVITLHITKRCNYDLYMSYLIQCETCQFATPFKQKLAEHCELIHSNRPKFACTLCPKEFVRLKSLRLHQTSHETLLMTKDYPCEYCPKAFVRKGLRSAHVKNIHIDANLRCEICNKNFTTRLSLRGHLKACS